MLFGTHLYCQASHSLLGMMLSSDWRRAIRRSYGQAMARRNALLAVSPQAPSDAARVRCQRSARTQCTGLVIR